LLRGAVSYSTGGRRRTLRQETLATDQLAWAHHDGFGYLLLERANATLGAARQTGSWQLINGNMPDEPVEKEVFSLWLDHGRDPREASYAYAVASNIALDKMSGWARHPGFEVLGNSTSLQAVRFGALTQVAFRQPGALELGDGLRLRVDRPCLLMLRRTRWGCRLSLAEPTQSEEQVTVTLTGHYSARGCRYVESAGETAVTFRLPRGGRAGATVTRRLVAQASLPAH
jgi:chondroitin AC lyase